MSPPLRLFALALASFAAMHCAVLAALAAISGALGAAPLRLSLDRAGLRYAAEFVATEALLLTGALSTGLVALAPFSASRALAALAFALVWWEAWFYAGHRLLHTRALFALHRPHHALSGVHPSLCFSVGETALLSSGFYLPLAIASRFGAVSVATLALTFSVAFALNALSHLDDNLTGGAHDRSALRHVLNSARFHAAHHGGARGNYGLISPWLDRAFATEVAPVTAGRATRSAPRSPTSALRPEA